MVGETLLEACNIRRGVRQGCSLSPLLFIIHDEAVVREVCHNCVTGIRVGGKIVNMIRYADDKAVVASSQEGLQELMTRLNAVTKEYDMKMNVNKTKVVGISRKGKSKVLQLIDDQQVEQVSQFKYLGSCISDDRYATKDTRVRIAMGKTLFMDKKKIVNRQIELQAKKQIINSTVWNVALYAAETWTLIKVSKKLLEAFEMWTWWNMLKISWTEKVTKEEVLVRANEAKSKLKTIWCSKRRWLGHVLRHNNLLHDITERKMLGKATRGRKRMESLHDMIEGKDYEQLKSQTDNACQKPTGDSRRLKKTQSQWSQNILTSKNLDKNCGIKVNI